MWILKSKNITLKLDHYKSAINPFIGDGNKDDKIVFCHQNYCIFQTIRTSFIFLK